MSLNPNYDPDRGDELIYPKEFSIIKTSIGILDNEKSWIKRTLQKITSSSDDHDILIRIG